MNPSFENKVAFVTGAANGIGRATALAFARAGASVVVADVSEKVQETTRMLGKGSVNEIVTFPAGTRI